MPAACSRYAAYFGPSRTIVLLSRRGCGDRRSCSTTGRVSPLVKFRDRYTREYGADKGEEFREIEGRARTANNTGPGNAEHKSQNSLG